VLALGARYFDGMPYLNNVEPVSIECAVRDSN